MKPLICSAILGLMIGSPLYAQGDNPESSKTPTQRAPDGAEAQAESTSQDEDVLDDILGPEDDTLDVEEDVAGTEVDTIPVEPLEVAESVERKAPRNRLIEEIVVTAQKREESVQDVPISISAFSGDSLDARGITEVRQLGNVVPSLQFSETVGYTIIYLRGVGTDAFIPSADPSIATYLDGVYLPAGHGVFQTLGGVSRVEVLKGPQGSLFGRNSTGGAISVTTKDPSSTDERSLEVEVGNIGSRNAKASISGPINDWFAASLAGLYKKSDNIYDSVRLGQLKDQVTTAARLKLEFLPSENIALSLSGLYTEHDGTSSTTSKNTDPSLLVRLLGQAPQEDNYQFEGDLPGTLVGEQRVIYGNFDWSLPWFDVKMIGSDQEILLTEGQVDLDATPLPLVAFRTKDEFVELRTAEMQFVSNENSWGSDTIEWVAGLFYLNSDVGYIPAELLVAPTLATSLLQSATGIVAPPGLVNLFNQIPGIGQDGVNLAFEGTMRTNSYSAFTQIKWFITDWLDLSLAGRYQIEERELTRANSGYRSPQGIYTQLFRFDLESAKVNNFSPKVVLSVRPADDVMVYLSRAIGFKSQSFNIVNIYAPPDYILPERVTAYELGLKSKWFDGLLTLNAATFHTKIKDLQAQFISVLAGGIASLENAGLAEINGAEFDAILVPMPDLNPGLVLTANAAYLDAQYTQYENGSGFDERTGVFTPNLDFSGNRIVRSPKLSGGLGFVQSFDISNGEMEVAADANYNSGFFYDSQNTVEENAFTLVNARISYLYLPWNVRITAFGNNLTDERYHIGRSKLDFGETGTLAAPRQYGLRLGWQF